MSVQERAPRPGLIWAAAMLPVLGAYANALSVGFMWDDHVLIEQNADLHTLHAPWTYLARSFWEHPFLYGQQPYYRPLVTLWLALDWRLGGGTPLVFHLTNLGLHFAVCTLVFVFALRRSRSAVTAGVVMALFGVMPRLTESVTWIVGRTDVLATLFVLLAFLAAEAKARAVRGLAGVCLLLGLLAKEVALLGVAVLIAETLLQVWRKQRTLGEVAPAAASSVAGLAGWLALRSTAGEGPDRGWHDGGSFLSGVGHHALLLLTPWSPNAQVGYLSDAEPWAIALGVAALAAVGVGALRWLRSDAPWRAVWLVGAMGGVVLVSAVVLPLYTIASDRFLYFPLALGAVVAAQRVWSRVPLLVGVAVMLAFCVVTERRNELWGEPLRFWQQLHDSASPRNVGAYAGLADVLSDLSRLEEALPLYRQAEQVRGPQRGSPSRLSVAVTESRLGHDAEALELLRKILEEDPDWRRAAYDLVLFQARALDFPAAREALAAARTRFGDDEVLREFEALLVKQEPLATRGSPLDRARALHALGATRKAQAIYEQLLGGKDSRVEAARWLVVFASEAAARRALEALGDDPAAKAAWAERFPEAR